jgi:thiol-disulfide isomerase/thioredoxin
LPALLSPFNSDARHAPANNSIKPALHLRTGDAIPCEATAIDEKGVTFEAETTEAKFVPHDKMKALELSTVQRFVNLDKVKRERLLTLPRMQRDNPPTHLIRFFDGDYLRARIESMDEEFLTVEVRLESKQFKRGEVHEIIWLHEDELGDESEQPEQQSLAPTHVQALRGDGTRLTFQPHESDGKLLAGVSEVLGRCHVELADVDILLIGKQVNDEAAQLPYGRWRLQHAIDPKFVSADGTIARPLGTESDMVGKPAPDFTLALLDGTSFQLSRRKGKIVILDFWATWCGPCIQAMPQVHAVVEEFKDRDVELVTVNLQEAPDKIKSTLERLKLDPAVALDIDGVVADRYAATSIPQTVIIDAEGNVARLFVGGDADFANQLRTALQAVVGDSE